VLNYSERLDESKFLWRKIAKSRASFTTISSFPCRNDDSHNTSCGLFDWLLLLIVLEFEYFYSRQETVFEARFDFTSTFQLYFELSYS
jgi:hypothetical protein